jgi:curved DNA-binding protein CbpA
MQNKNSNKKTGKFIVLFGLGPNFTLEELNGSYRMLAKLNHPDVNRDMEAEMRMVIVNEGYEFLKRLITSGGLAEEINDLSAEHIYKEDKIYLQYKKAFTSLKNAFDGYFGLTDKLIEGKLDLLREKLSAAKDEFSMVINDYPYNEWVDDSIDKINSINKWL